MTIKLEIKPETEAELSRQAELAGHPLERYAAGLLDVAAQVQAPNQASQTGRALIEAGAKIRGLLTDEEVDSLFSRTPSPDRPVYFE